GLQLVNFLQDVPRDLALGRVYMPADDRARFAVVGLDRPSPQLRALLEFEADRARGLLSSGEELGRKLGGGGGALAGGRVGGCGAGGARARRLGHLQRPASAVAYAARAGGAPLTVAEAYAEVERITRREARNFAYGIRVLPREKRQAISAVYAFARRVDDIA